MVRTAVVGLGKMGISHLSILNQNENVEIVGVCDKSRIVLDALRKLTSFKCYDDYEELTEKAKPECVVISTPTSTHYEITKFFLKKGVNVFVEKPLSTDYQRAQELTEIAAVKSLHTQVGYHNRFVATFRYVKSLLDEQVLGKAYHFMAEVNGPAFVKESKISWRSKTDEGGGALLDYGSHLINLINYYWDLPIRVTGTIMKRIFSAQSEDAIFSNFIFSNGLTGSISVNWSEKTFRRMSILITILGKKGKLIVDSQECKIFLTEGNKAANLDKGWNFRYITDLAHPVDFFVRGEEYTEQLNHFICGVSGQQKRSNVNSFENSTKTNRTIEMLGKDAVWS
jgi:predicted dehydrogenase